MIKYFSLLGLFVCLRATAQLPEDALRASWTVPSGTARSQAIGGAMGSIGGDITASYVNPAGIGLYKVSEFVLSPGWRSLKDKASYQGTDQTGAAANNFNLGTSGAVFAYASATRPGVTNAFSISVNRTANFNNQINYQGNNRYSSFSEQYVEEFAASGFGIEEGIGSPYLSYGTRMALYTSLIDTATIGGQLQVIGNPQKSSLLLQRNNLRTSGGITEINLALATSQHDKWYFGGSLGIPIMSYTQERTWFESDASGNTNNDFESFSYHERFTTKGFGVNLKFGAIWRPSNSFRLGAAIHSPSVFNLTDRISASMDTRTENYTTLKEVAVTSDQLDVNLNPPPNMFKYTLNTPWHFLLSGSYLFGGGEKDFKQQKGFITADIEYITTGSPSFGAADNGDGSDGDNSYYDAVNQAIKDAYKGSFVGRLGGEMKFNTWMVRAGGAYYTSPYEGQGLKVDRATLSAGLGYRDKGYFVDLAYVIAFNRDINVPYYLNDKVNTYAALKETGGTVVLTAGIKF